MEEQRFRSEQLSDNYIMDSLDKADYQLQLPQWSLENLKTASIQLNLCRPRSLAWAIMLNAIPPLPQNNLISSLINHRHFYNDLKLKLSKDPRAVIGDDPLSQNDESVWHQHFCDNELKALILQDVVRTYPDELFFREKQIEAMMVRVLFFWARSHSNIGYRQGMHEILAPLLYELHIDRKFAPNVLCENLKIFLDDVYLEHDSYMLFSAIMNGLEKFYTTGDIVPTSCGRLPTSRVVHNPNEVVIYLENVREEYLVPLDSELATHLANCNISMELFGIRWLRLLFGREFHRSEIPVLWSFIFADGPMLPNVHYLIVALLISMRSTLLSSDSGGVLSALMRSAGAPATYVCALAAHLRRPHDFPRPPAPPCTPHHATNNNTHGESSRNVEQQLCDVDERHAGVWEGGDECAVAEGEDVARSLAALALVRARLPPAAAALALALPRPPPHVLQPLQQILQLASLLQCRNHALIDVETALEAAEGQTTEKVGRRQLVPVSIIGGRRTPSKQNKQVNSVKEVPLTVFHEFECKDVSDFPNLDPVRLRTQQ